MSIHVGVISAIPLNERGNLHKPQLVFEVHELLPGEQIRQKVSFLLINGDVLEPHYSPLHHVMDVVVLDLNML